MDRPTVALGDLSKRAILQRTRTRNLTKEVLRAGALTKLVQRVAHAAPRMVVRNHAYVLDFGSAANTTPSVFRKNPGRATTTRRWDRERDQKPVINQPTAEDLRPKLRTSNRTPLTASHSA